MKRRRKDQRRPGSRAGIRIGTNGAPTEGADAGPDDDLRREHMVRQVRHYRGLATRQFETARRSCGSGHSFAESEARRAIDSAVRAFWWAEDSDLEGAQH